MINISNSKQAQKLFNELDSTDDPLGLKALKHVDFRSLGIFMPNKAYSSASEAAKSLELSRQKVQSYLDHSKVR